MAPPPLDLPNQRPFFERHQVAIAGFLLKLAVDAITFPLVLWPWADRMVERVDTGKTGQCRVCIYTPHASVARSASRPRGVVVHVHGGGWTIGCPEAEMALCRYLCDELGVVVVAPDYRKAPRYPYPHALEQCYSVLVWIASGGLSRVLGKQKQPIDMDVTRIALSGASAGSNLAASLTLLSLERPLPQACQVVGLGLLYPALNLDVPYKDKLARVDPTKVLLPLWMSRLFFRAYLPPPRSTSDPYVSPALAAPGVLARFPSTVVLTAAYDYLAHEADEFAHHLLGLGVRVEHKRFTQVGHAFDAMPARDRRQRVLNGDARDEAWEMMAGVFRDVLSEEEEDMIKVQVLKN